MGSSIVQEQLGVTCNAIVEYLNSLPPPSSWAYYQRLFVPGLCTTTTSAAESMNSSTKNGFMAVAPCMGIETSTGTMITKSNERAAQKAFSDARQKHSNKLWSRSSTNTILTDYAEGLACDAFDRRSRYAVAKSKSEQLVRITTFMLYELTCFGSNNNFVARHVQGLPFGVRR